MRYAERLGRRATHTHDAVPTGRLRYGDLCTAIAERVVTVLAGLVVRRECKAQVAMRRADRLAVFGLKLCERSVLEKRLPAGDPTDVDARTEFEKN